MTLHFGYIFPYVQCIYSVACNMHFQLQCYLEYCSNLEHQQYYSLQQNYTQSSQPLGEQQFSWCDYNLNSLVINSYSWNLSRWLWIYCGKYSHRYVYQLSQQGWCFATWMMFLQQCMFNNALSSICTLAIFQCCAWTERALFMIRFLYVSKKFDSSLTNVHHVVTQSAKAAELHSTTGKRGVLL